MNLTILNAFIKLYLSNINSGQTGSGKTYTMLGPSEQQFDKNQGLIPRTINHLFQLAFNKKQLVSY